MTVRNVTARMMTKNRALNAQCTPTNRPQASQSTSEIIIPDTEIAFFEQFGHFLFNLRSPLVSTGRFESVAASQQSITRAAAFG